MLHLLRRVIGLTVLACVLAAAHSELAGAARAPDQAPRARPGVLDPAAAAQEPGGDALVGFLDAVLGDVTSTWQRVLAPTGASTGTTGRWFSLASEPFLVTGCGPVDGEVSPFYCPADDTIYLSSEFADAVLDFFGDMALVAVVAHEYGHNVQSELGLVFLLRGEALELQADCFGGAYAGDAAVRGLLEPGDEAEARAITRAAGDFSAGSPQGTPDEREAAWLQGFQNGFAACL